MKYSPIIGFICSMVCLYKMWKCYYSRNLLNTSVETCCFQAVFLHHIVTVGISLATFPGSSVMELLLTWVT